MSYFIAIEWKIDKIHLSYCREKIREFYIFNIIQRIVDETVQFIHFSASNLLISR